MAIIGCYFLFPTLTEEKQPTLEGWISSILQRSEFGCSEFDVLGLMAGTCR